MRKSVHIAADPHLRSPAQALETTSWFGTHGPHVANSACGLHSLGPDMQTSSENPRNAPTDAKAVTILARSLFRQMQDQGYSSDQIIGLSSELVELVTGDLQKAAAAE